MKKLILCASVAAVIVVTLKIATATEPVANPKSSTQTSVSDSSYILSVYNEFDFADNKKLSFDAFAAAFRGYLNLKNEGKLNEEKPILSIADFTLSSTQQRLWILDLANRKVLFNDFVAHGQGSGGEFATAFSNTANSHQSSIGFYITDNTYVGKHGTSLRLRGMDKGYNSAAYDRAIVIHGADYVSSSFISSQKRLGRSWGCPAVSRQAIGKVIDYIKGGTCLFIYYPEKSYLTGSVWLNKKLNRLPEYFAADSVQMASAESKPVKYIYAENAQDLNPESPLYAAPQTQTVKVKL